MVFDLNPFKPVTFVYKVRPCTLPFRPTEAVPYLSSKYGTAKKSIQKTPLAAKVFNRTKRQRRKSSGGATNNEYR